MPFRLRVTRDLNTTLSSILSLPQLLNFLIFKLESSHGRDRYTDGQTDELTDAMCNAACYIEEAK